MRTDGQADGRSKRQRDMRQLIVALRNFSNALKNLLLPEPQSAFKPQIHINFHLNFCYTRNRFQFDRERGIGL
jgi:hypothetical protein